MKLGASEFDFLRKLVKQHSGISLNDDKEYLVESRMLPLIRKHGLASFADLVARLSARPDPKLIQEAVEAMTTNETMFFRDTKPFDAMKNVVLPARRAAGSAELNIWCAACSSGQEPYSLALMFQDQKDLVSAFRTLEIIGTDIDSEMVARAKQGMYSQFEVQRGLPIQMLMKYFAQAQDHKDRWQIKEEIKSKVRFDTLNLLHEFTRLPAFDVIFCRNVMIYFDTETKKQILHRLSQKLKPGGFLFLGSSETVMELSSAFSGIPGSSGLYQLNAPAAQAKAYSA